MGKRFNLEFDGLDRMLKKLTSLEVDIQPVVDDALTETFNTVTNEVQSAMASSKFNFHHTGKTAGSLVSTPSIQKFGTMSSVYVGFDIGHGGLASIFLMHGTPKIEPDRNLYNAFYGKAVLTKVRDVQQQAFAEAIRKAMKT